MRDYHSRMQGAAELVQQFEKFVAGLEEHPRALERVPKRLGIRTVKSILRKLQKIEEKRENLQDKMSELNREEEAILSEYKDDFQKIRQIVKAIYAGQKGVWDDFV